MHEIRPRARERRVLQLRDVIHHRPGFHPGTRVSLPLEHEPTAGLAPRGNSQRQRSSLLLHGAALRRLRLANVRHRLIHAVVQLLQSETHVEGALHAEVVVGGGRETLECVTDVHERAVGVRRAEEGFKDGQGGGLEGVETALDAAAAVGGAILQAAFAEEVKGGLELAWGGAGEGGDGGVDPLGSVPDLVSVGHDGRGDARGRGRGGGRTVGEHFVRLRDAREDGGRILGAVLVRVVLEGELAVPAASEGGRSVTRPSAGPQRETRSGVVATRRGVGHARFLDVDVRRRAGEAELLVVVHGDRTRSLPRGARAYNCVPDLEPSSYGGQSRDSRKQFDLSGSHFETRVYEP